MNIILLERIEKLGQIDVLVCNAATNPFMGSMLDMPLEKFDKVKLDGFSVDAKEIVLAKNRVPEKLKLSIQKAK